MNKHVCPNYDDLVKEQNERMSDLVQACKFYRDAFHLQAPKVTKLMEEIKELKLLKDTTLNSDLMRENAQLAEDLSYWQDKYLLAKSESRDKK